jgi:hypothetical protein
MSILRSHSLYFRYKYSSRHFILPVVIYSITYNLPKFWELTTVCPPTAAMVTNNTQHTYNLDNSTTTSSASSSSCPYWQLVLVARDIR